jgi:alpha/beta superfamily hydrolase
MLQKENAAMEEIVFFQSGNLLIEGRYAESGTEKGVVISHPHPQMGGSMWNNVVETLVSFFIAKNYSTLRFNFRGVGKSEGTYDEGKGEQQDIMAAANYLSTLNKKDIILTGYSFGAWVTVNVISSHEGFKDAILISPPVLFLEFDFSRCHDKIGLMTCGEQDQFASLDSLSSVAAAINSRLEIIKGADHFYLGKEREISEILDQYL